MTDVVHGEVRVPEFRETVFRPRRAPFALCVFVVNEAERIGRQLERMRPYADLVDVVVADGGSTDGSLEESRLRAAGVNTLLVKLGPGRLGAQMRMALLWSLDRGYDGVVVMDGNDKDDPAAIPRFVESLERGFDHVQGSRFVRGGRGINTPTARWLGVRAVHAPLIRLASGFPYTDTTNGFRAYSRSLLEDPAVAPFRDCFSEYELHYYLAIRAARLGYRVCEIPVTRAYPTTNTPTKIKGLSGNLKILRTLRDACLGCWNPVPPNAAAGASRRDAA